MRKGKSNARWVTGGLIAGLIIILIVVFASFRGRGFGAGGEIIATVNGEPITRETFNTLKAVPLLIGNELGQPPPVLSDYDVFSDYLDNVLMVQSATEAGFEVPEQDIQDEILVFLTSIGTTPEEFEKVLAEHDVRWESYVDSVRMTLIADKYAEEKVLNRVDQADRDAFLTSWLVVLKQEATIEVDPGFLDELDAD